MRKTILSIAVSCLLFTSFAATRSWNGAGVNGGNGATDFNNGANWLPTGILNTVDDLIINLNNNSTNTILLSANLSANSLTINGNVTNVGNGGRAFTINIGNFFLTLTGNHSVINNCYPTGGQTGRPFNIIITNSSAGSFNIGGNLSATNTDISTSANTIQYIIDGGLTINGTTLAKSLNTLTASYVNFLVGNSPAKIRYTGNVTLDDNTGVVGNTIYLGSTTAASTGSIEFDGNVNLGYIAATNSLFTAATVTFDGTTTQTYTTGNTDYYFRLPNVIIGNTNSPTVLMASANAVIPDNLTGNLTINNSSILDLNTLQWNRNSNGGSFFMKSTSSLKLSAAASLANLGSATPFTGSNFPAGFTTVTLDSTSTVNFNGTAQTIPLPTAATVYGNLTLSGSGTKTVGGNISFNGGLDIGTGVTMALGNSITTLKSNAQTTAFVRPVNGTITYGTGKFIIERFLKATASWRLMATPITSASSPTISAAWREGQAIGTNTTAGFGTRITGPTGMDEYTQRASMKYYNMANNTYVDVNAAALAQPIQKDQGYYVFVRGDRTVAVGGTTGTTNLRIAGQLRTGNQTFSVIKNLAPASGFQSIGNPYASRIDVRNVILFAGGVAETFYIWNPTGGFYGVGQFENYTKFGTDFRRNGSPVGAVLNTIESGQGFFLQNNSTTTDGSITIKESDKVIGSSLVSRVGVTSQTLEISLFTNDATGVETLVDGASINFDANYANTLDNNDVRKITNTYDNIGLKQGTANLVVERRNTLVKTDTLTLNMTGMRVASYKFEIDPSVLGNLPLNAFLLDKFLVTETPVNLTAVTTVAFSTTSDAASRAADRFKIVFRPIGVLPVTFTGIAAEINANKTHTVKWFVSNEVNLSGYVVERSGNGVRFDAIGNSAVAGTTAYSFIDASPLATLNYYRVKATSANGQVQYSAVVKLSSAATQPGFSIQPNPVVNKTLHINFENMKGSYSMSLLSKQGATVFTKQVNVASLNEVQHILVAGIAAGVYDVLLVNTKGNQTVQTIIIQ